MLIESNLTLFYANYAVLYKTLLFCLLWENALKDEKTIDISYQ